MRLFKKIKKVSQSKPFSIVILCGAMMALVLVAVYISSGGIAKLNHLLASSGVLPGSQTASIVFVGLYEFAATPQYIAPGSNVTLSWLANGADNCYVQGPGANTYYASGSGVYSVSVGPLYSTSQYTAQCFNYGPSNSGSSVQESATVTISGPTTITSFTASPNPVDRHGRSGF
jgi:hypothetical protein